MKESEFKEYTKQVVGEVAAETIKALLDEQMPALKGQLQEQFEAKLKEMNPAPTPEELAIEEAKKKNPWKSFGEYLNSIYQARHYSILDNRLVYIGSDGKIAQPVLTKDAQAKIIVGGREKVMTEGTDSAGGFLVPEQFVAQVQMIGLETAIIRNNGPMIMPMISDTLNIPTIVETSHASHVWGGMYFAWTEEGGAKTEVQPTFGSVKLTAHEGSGYTVVSNALLADSAIALEPLLRRMIGEAVPYYEDDAFISGNGVGKPLGLLTSGATILVPRQGNTVVRWMDFVNIFARILPSSRDRGIWLMNHEVWPYYLSAVSENAAPAATAGSVIVVSKEQGAVKPVPQQLFGRPVFLTEKMAALGSAGDIGFFDLSYYIIGDRQTLTIDASTHVYFTYNKTAWRFVIRVDGQPWLNSPITPKNGTATLSPFAILSSTS